jgi:hypothetical protein
VYPLFRPLNTYSLPLVAAAKPMEKRLEGGVPVVAVRAVHVLVVGLKL